MTPGIKEEELARLAQLAVRSRDAQRAADEAQAARNQAIVRAVRSGATVREIADAAGIAPSTVSWLTTRRLDIAPRKRGRRPREVEAAGD